MGHLRFCLGKETTAHVRSCLLSDRAVLVISAASKEAVMHHTPAKQEKDNQQNDCKHDLSKSERGRFRSCRVGRMRFSCHARAPFLQMGARG